MDVTSVALRCTSGRSCTWRRIDSRDRGSVTTKSCSIGTLTERAPERGNLARQIVLLHGGVRPDPAQEFILTDDVIAMFEQDDEDVEGFRRDRHEATVAPQPPLDGIDDERTEGIPAGPDDSPTWCRPRSSSPSNCLRAWTSASSGGVRSKSIGFSRSRQRCASRHRSRLRGSTCPADETDPAKPLIMQQLQAPTTSRRCLAARNVVLSVLFRSFQGPRYRHAAEAA